MSLRRTLIRLGRIAFGLLARCLPAQARRAWRAEATSDLHRLLESAGRTGGSRAVARVAIRSLMDLAGRVPAEWTRVLSARRRHHDVNAGEGRLGWGERIMTMWNELRIALRTLARRPGYSATASLTLALGIAGSVAIFTVVHAVLLKPLPYPDSDRIVSIQHHAPGLDLPVLENSEGTLALYAQEADFLAEVAAYDTGERNLVGGARPERVEVVQLSPGLLPLLGVDARLGRGFTADDAGEDVAPVAILSHEAWVNRFGADPGVVGTTVRIDDRVSEIVGVMPEGFGFPSREVEIYLPLYLDPQGPFGAFGLAGVGRLAPGVTLTVAASQAQALQELLPEMHPGLEADFLERAGWSVSLERLQDRMVGTEVASALWIVLATVGVVFLIACANVTNLFLVRAESRQKELAVRAAMGAGGRRLAGGFLAESLVLGAAGGLVGGPLAAGAVGLLVRHGPSGIPRLQEVALGPLEMGLTALLALVAGILLAVLPALRWRNSKLAGILRDGGRASTDGPGRHRARNLLVAGQLAMALVLLVGSGLMLRSFDAVRGVDPGFEPTDVVTVGLSLGEGVDERTGAAFYQEVSDRVSALPGVASVGLANAVPLAGGSANGGSFYVESVPRDEGELPPVAMYKAVGADYLESLGQPLLRGRTLARSDWESGEPVVLVNETFARRFLPGDGLGEAIRWDEDLDFARVVGVVADVREMELTEPPRAWAYLPLVVGEWGYPNMDRAYLTVRTHEGASLSAPAIREIVAGLDPTVPLTSIRTMEEVFAAETTGTSFTMTLLLIAALTALLLGSIGLFGVISYVVGQRTREIGVRVALGARAEEIRALVFRQGIGVVAAGVVLGLSGAFGLSRLMGSILYGVSTSDPISFVLAPVVLVGVALLATWLPARRAARVDPLEALRAE